MSVRRWESFLKRQIDGIFHRNTSNTIAPAEIEEAIEREVMRRKRKGARGRIVPNVYTIRVHEDDYQRLYSHRFLDDLYVFSEKLLILADVYMEQPLKLLLTAAKDISPGTCHVASRFVEAEEECEAQAADGGTIVLQRSAFAVPMHLPKERLIASLRVTEGADKDTVVSFGERMIYIGRRPQNECILTDVNASRLHAYIDYVQHRHVLCDAGSLNGTFVNDRRVKDMVLQDNDEIRIGNTRLVYEVL